MLSLYPISIGERTGITSLKEVLELCRIRHQIIIYTSNITFPRGVLSMLDRELQNLTIERLPSLLREKGLLVRQRKQQTGFSKQQKTVSTPENRYGSKHAHSRRVNATFKTMECNGSAAREISPTQDKDPKQGIPALHLRRPCWNQNPDYVLHFRYYSSRYRACATPNIHHLQCKSCPMQHAVLNCRPPFPMGPSNIHSYGTSIKGSHSTFPSSADIYTLLRSRKTQIDRDKPRYFSNCY